jgi:serine/alanine adding enzyme
MYDTGIEKQRSLSADRGRESGLHIAMCDAAEQDLWEAYVDSSPSATLSHCFRWQRIINRVYGHQSFYVMAQRDSRVCGIVPLFLVKSRLFGTSLTSMPFLDYGGICADDDVIAQLLLEQARGLMQEHEADWIELRQCEPPSGTTTLRLDKVSLILDLSMGAEALWRSLKATVRNQVRKAIKSGLTASVGGAELLDEFYPVFASNMRDLGSPVHHRAFFAQILAEFGAQARLILVCDGQRAVGGLVALFFKDTIAVPWASSLRQYFPKCPNNLLYWEAIQYGCAHGCRRFDFGRSSVGSGTYNFKRQWGAEPMQLYWQVLSKNGNHGGNFSADNPRYRVILEAWRRLPLAFTNFLGPHIRKYLTN